MLFEITDIEQRAAELRCALAGSNAAERAPAAHVLGSMSRHLRLWDVVALEKALADPDPVVRASAVRALSLIARAIVPSVLRVRVAAALDGSIGDRSAEVRATVARSIGEVARSLRAGRRTRLHHVAELEAHLDALLALERDADEGVRAAAVGALDLLGACVPGLRIAV